MKQRETKKYVNKNGVDTYEYGCEFEPTDFKVGDKVVVYGSGYGINYEYQDRAKCYIDTVEKVNLKKGIITLSNGINYKQDTEVTYLYKGYKDLYKGYKEVNYLGRFISTRDPEYIAELCYDFKNKEIYNGNIKPRFVTLYDEPTKKKIADFTEEVKKLDIERKQKELEKARQKEIYNKYQAEYDKVIKPLEEQLEELEEKIIDERAKAFDKAFCANCKTGCQRKCAFERYWHSNDYVDENHMYEYDGEKYRSRPSNKCDFFVEKAKEE